MNIYVFIGSEEFVQQNFSLRKGNAFMSMTENMQIKWLSAEQVLSLFSFHDSDFCTKCNFCVHKRFVCSKRPVTPSEHRHKYNTLQTRAGSADTEISFGTIKRFKNRKAKRALIFADTGHKSSRSNRLCAGLPSPSRPCKDRETVQASPSYSHYITEPHTNRWLHHGLINFPSKALKSNFDMRALLGGEKHVILLQRTTQTLNHISEQKTKEQKQRRY